MTGDGRHAAIRAVSSGFPEASVSTADLESIFGIGSVSRLAAKTGISSRRVARCDELASDLAVLAAENLFTDHAVDREAIDFVLLCTQTPDHPMPTTACIAHGRLGLRADCGALDIGMGCSGFVYGLGLAKGLIESRQAENVLLITADTVTKYINPQNRQLRTIFGDGGAATLISGDATEPSLQGFAYGSDGTGARHLLVPNGGLGDPRRIAPGLAARDDEASNGFDMHMDGAEVFSFTLRVVPDVIERSLASSGLEPDDIDLYVFHQANAFMLEALRTKVGIDPERFVVDMADCGNTMSSTIPIALSRAVASGRARPGMRVMLVGFGVGLSWGAVVATV